MAETGTSAAACLNRLNASGFGLEVIALAVAIAAAALASAMVSRAMWELFYRRWRTTAIYQQWRTPRIGDGSEANLRIPAKMLAVPTSAFGLPSRAFAAQVAARLHVQADLAPSSVHEFLMRAAALPEEDSGGAAVSVDERGRLTLLIDRAVDDLQSRLEESASRSRYTLNIAVATLLCLLAAWSLGAWNIETKGVAVVAGVMAGLAGALIQTWIGRTLDR